MIIKKILYLHAGAELYGADKVLLELLKNLNKEEFVPYVILPEDGPLVKELIANNITTKIIPYPILRRKYFNPVGIIRYIKSYIKYSRKVIETAKNEKIDIIHTNTAAVLEGALVKSKLRIPQIWHIHEIIVKPQFVHKLLSVIIAKSSNVTITVSEAVKKHLMNTVKFNNINVIYNGVDNSEYTINNKTEYLRDEFNIPKDGIVVGMIGRVNSWKGQDDFLNAMEIVLESNDNVFAMLVGGVFKGEEWRVDELKKKINNIKNKDRIIMSDYRSDIKNIHALYDIFILPSTNPDPLPTVVLEAMASSTPVIGYRHGGVCEMIIENECGYLVNVSDTHNLAEAIIELVNNEKRRKEFSNNALARQKQYFSLRSYVDNFEELYRKFK